MITLAEKYAALERLGYDCDTCAGEITKWRDARPQPESWEAILALAAAAASRKVWSGKRAFDGEFSDAETYALETSVDPTLVVLRGRLNRWEGEIYADDSRVQAGLTRMVALGILTDARKRAIDGSQ
jgi:hypothetical protein